MGATVHTRKRWVRVVAPAVCLLAALLLAPAAGAATFNPPEVFLKELDASDMPMGNWVPLAGAQMHSVNGYEIGVRLQNTGASGNSQRILVQLTSVPNGRPDLQKNIYSLCIPQSGAAGEIVRPDQRVRYAGDGTYTLSVTVSTDIGDASAHCADEPGAATTMGSFTASAPTSAHFEGHLLLSDPSAHHKFGGLVMFPAVGAGETEVICARDPRPAAGGTLTGSLTFDRDLVGSQENPSHTDAATLFPKPGRWACVARSVSAGVIPGPWSAPTATVTVQTGFYRPADGNTRLTDARGPVYRMSLKLDPLTAGGRLTVELRRFGKPKQRTRIKLRIRRGGVAAFSFRLPRLGPNEFDAHYVEYLTFGGTQLVAARPAFGDVAIDAISTARGRVDLEFTAPCAPHRC
jgi:hypothetical protein